MMNWRNLLRNKARLRAIWIGLGGMIVGSIVGIGVQVAVESTGVLGPSVDALLVEQESNFAEIGARLDALRSVASDAQSNAEIERLAQLLQRQEELQLQAKSEIQFLGKQVSELRGDALGGRGFAAGADFWLGVGESVSVGNHSNVMGLVYKWGAAADVVLNGEKTRIPVGGSVSTDECKVFLKQAVAREDGRIGFDISCG